MGGGATREGGRDTESERNQREGKRQREQREGEAGTERGHDERERVEKRAVLTVCLKKVHFMASDNKHPSRRVPFRSCTSYSASSTHISCYGRA